MKKVDPSIFKSYDIRGIYGETLTEDIAEMVGRGFAKYLDFPKQVIVARDGRTHGKALQEHIIKALLAVGVDVIDIGLASSDMYYYACATQKLPGISVTASHNPKEYNGFKMVKQIPHLLSGDEGIKHIKEYIEEDSLPKDADKKGKVTTWDVMDEFIEHILSVVDQVNFTKLTIHADTANGMVGPILKKLDSKLPTISFVPMYWEVDGTFPNHGGDPLDAQNRKEIEERVPKEHSDLGVMFDPDGDRFLL
jgi:phosphomannomutase